MKATAIAPSNIAFIKYWGKKDEVLRLPANGSISMNLSNLTTTTTVDFSPEYAKDIVIITDVIRHHDPPKSREAISYELLASNGIASSQAPRNDIAYKRVIVHLDRIRKYAGISEFARVVSRNNYPSSTGLSSSASGFAALTVAGAAAAGLHLSEKELTILARQSSGSACRSIPSGFVEWKVGNTSETSYAMSLHPPHYWEIADVVAVLDYDKKAMSTTDGQKMTAQHPFFSTRLMRIGVKLTLLKKILKHKDFTALGEVTEAEAMELVAMHLTSAPPLIFLKPDTLRLMELVRRWRREGLEVYFSLNTGHNTHCIVQQKDVDAFMKKLDQVEGVRETFISVPGEGAKILKEHLF